MLVIGVNGVGKTTTVGKLAGKLKEQGKKVVIAGADTFRAAAGDQLKEWANRAGVDMSGGAEEMCIRDRYNKGRTRCNGWRQCTRRGSKGCGRCG